MNLTTDRDGPDPSLSSKELLSLAGETALVTGGASGIGFAIVQRLSDAGASVLILDADGDAAAAAASALTDGAKAPRSAVDAMRCDVTNEQELAEAITAAESKLGAVNILVNSAGIYPPGVALEMPLTDWDRVLEINLRGTFSACRLAARAMIASGAQGRIVNVSSTSAFRYPFPGMPHYSAAKAGVNALTRSLAIELGGHGIRVNAVAPGGTETEGQLAKRASGGFPQALLDLVERSPLRRFALPDEQARVVLFLASPASSYVTGQCLVVDGGMTLV